MKQGFSKKAKKAAKKKAAKKKKKLTKKQQQAAGGPDMDAEMQDAPIPGSGAAGSEDGIDYTFHKDEPGKSDHKTKLQLKRALKVQVASLKNKRAKLTKLPANKAARKELNAHIREAMHGVKALSAGGSPQGAGQQPQPGGPQQQQQQQQQEAGMMAE